MLSFFDLRLKFLLLTTSTKNKKMEKTRLCKLLKVGMLCFGVSLLLWNCEKQEDAFQPVSSNKTSVLDFNELPTSIADAIGEVNRSVGVYQKGSNGLILNKDQIIKVVDSLSNTSYSLQFSLANTPKNVIYNLIVTTNEDHIAQKPFIIKYTIDNLEEITHDNDFVDYTSMKAKIEFYEYQKFLSSNHLKQKMAYPYYNRPCYTYDYDGYGGNGSYGNQGNNSGTGSSGFVSGTLFVWRNSGGSVLGITWSFTDGTNGYALKGGNNCRSSSGGSMQGGSTGLNFGNNGPIDPRDEECGEGETFVDGICVSNDSDEEQIFNELTGKAKCVYDKLQELSSGFKNVIQKFDGEFPVSHLNIILEGLGNTRGETRAPDGAGTSPDYVITIAINDNSNIHGVNYRPNLMTAKTIIHEVIHAEMFRKLLSVLDNGGNIAGVTRQNVLDALDGDFPGMYDYYRRHKNWQHQQMATHYRETIVDVLKGFDNNQHSIQFYMDLAWEGLKYPSISAWSSLSAQERDRINKVISDYINDNKKETCQQ